MLRFLCLRLTELASVWPSDLGTSSSRYPGNAGCTTPLESANLTTFEGPALHNRHSRFPLA